jgi:hypothetical protein
MNKPMNPRKSNDINIWVHKEMDCIVAVDAGIA